MRTKFIKFSGLLILALIFSASCGEKKKQTSITEQKGKSDIEVIYFYGNQRCATCVAMEKFAKEAIDSVFPALINDGKLSFKSVDITTPEGEKLADSFEVTSSSLFVVNNKPGNPEKADMTAFGFRNARNNRHIYKQGVIDQINKFLD